MLHPITRHALLFCLLLSFASNANAQGSKADYERAAQQAKQFRGKVKQLGVSHVWVGEGGMMWYRLDHGQNGRRWYAVVSATGKSRVAFDHDKLAEKLSEAAGKHVTADRLRLDALRVAQAGKQIAFNAFNKRWVYELHTHEIRDAGDRDPSTRPETRPRNRWANRHSRQQSPDTKWSVAIRDNNVVLTHFDEEGRPAEDKPFQLTSDGSRENSYISQFFWSADSTKLVVLKRKAGDQRRVTIIDTAPDRQFQPKTDSYFYLKPGDKVTIDRPVLFDIETKQQIELSTELAPNPYRISGVRWNEDSSAFTYEYNQRGHQVYRVIEVDAKTGESRAVISEEPETFFTYSRNKYLHYLDDTNELLWLSERDGWNHLYLYDWASGKVKRQVTKGEWVVRSVDRVDEEARTVWFWAGGIYPDQDPYHLHYCRVDLDTGKVTPLTASDGTHTDLSVSPDGKTLVTTWSRIDHPPVHELRSAVTGELIKEIARADATLLIESGWVAPERFVAKGRDGETDIYGIIIKPTHFDPNKKYPVIENIYAGPHGAHVPKKFYEVMRTQQLAELGFIVVRIDGMGTNHRSKAFHDVAWKNIKDAGFPDRIAWMKAAAKDRPWMDLSRVGIYGGSAGGQNAMRAVLDHHDFYKAAAADCGCHDNRMDKIWWNEQWMGWPVDESYIASSNSEDAHKLGGKLLLTVGELDRNVDPASTYHVVDALIKANKDFELMVFTGMGHGAGSSPYGTRLRADFFVRHLHGVEPRWE